MANDIISEDYSNFYVRIREDEIRPYLKLVELATTIYDRGLAESWVTADEHAHFVTMKDAAIIKENKTIQKEAAARFFYALSAFFMLTHLNSFDRMSAIEYTTIKCLFDELSSFTKNELYIGYTIAI